MYRSDAFAWYSGARHEYVGCPFGEWDQAICAPCSPKINPEPDSLLPPWLVPVGRVYWISAWIKNWRIVGADDSERGLAEVTTQSGENVHFQHVNHHRIQTAEPPQ